MASTLQRALNLLKAPIVGLGRSYNETARKWPMRTGVITTLVKTSAADLFAQKVVEAKEEMDWRRHGMFCLFGLGYLGCFQYYLYNHLFVQWCKPITAAVGHLGAAPIKTFIDQCIHHPLVYFPAFYTLKGAVEGRPIAETYDKYRADLWENCKALWMIWVPAQMVNFTVVPLHLRIPFVAAVSFAWTVVISVMRGTLDSRQQPDTSSASSPSSSAAKSAAVAASAAAAGTAAAAAAAATNAARTSAASLQPLLQTGAQ